MAPCLIPVDVLPTGLRKHRRVRRPEHVASVRAVSQQTESRPRRAGSRQMLLDFK